MKHTNDIACSNEMALLRTLACCTIVNTQATFVREVPVDMEIKPLTIQLSWLIMHTWMTQCTNLSILLCLLEYFLWYCLVLAICHYGDSDRITWHMVQGDTRSPSPTQLNSSSNCLSFTSSCTMYILYRAQGNRDTYTCVHILSQNNLHIQYIPLQKKVANWWPITKVSPSKFQYLYWICRSFAKLFSQNI